MAEKEFKRKARLKTGPGINSPAPVAGVHVPQNSTTTGQRELGAPYRAGPAFGLASHEIAEPKDNALDNDARQEKQSGGYQQVDSLLQNTDLGIVIPLQQRQRLQHRFGRDFSGVRLHIGPAADKTTHSLSSMAFTHGNHIWLNNRVNPTDDRILSHELTHMVQQGYAQPLQGRSAISLTPHSTPTPVADHGNQAATSHTTTSPASGTVQRLDIWDSALSLGGRAVSTVRGTARYVRNTAGELIEAGADYFIGLAEEWAPGLVEFLRSDILTVIKEKIVSALSDRFSTLLSGINVSGLIAGLSDFFTDFIQEFMDAKQGLVKKTCSGIQRAAKKLVKFVKDIGQSAFNELKEVFGDLKQFFSDVWSDIAPGIESIKTYAGEVWTEITEQATELWNMTEPLRQQISDTWDWIKETFDIAWTSSRSVLGWLSDKASEALELAKEILQPVIEHLKVVGAVLVMLTPLGPILLVKEAASYFWDAIKELAEKVNIGEWIVQAYSFVVNELLPMIRSGIELVKSLLTMAKTFIYTMVSSLVSAVGAVLEIMGVTPLLRFARDQIMQLWNSLVVISNLFSVLWNMLVDEAEKVISELWEKLKPILKTLNGIVALVTNPMNWIIFATGLVANLAWYLIPECLKKPLVEFLLDLAIDFVSVVEPPGTYAYTWEVVQAGLLGFLQKLRSKGPDQIIQFIEKTIVVPITPSFYSGFTLGVIKGLVWDSIIGFFIAIYNLITAIPSAISAIFRFFLSLGFDFEAIDALIQRALDIKDQVIAFIQSPDALQQIVLFIRRTPSILIGMIETAITEAADWAKKTGEQLADAVLNFGLTKSAFDIGIALGTITGILLFEVLLLIFTGSIGNIVKWGGKALGWLSKGVRWLKRGLGQGTGLIGRAFRMMQRIADAGFSIARRIAGRLGPIIQKVKTLFDDIVNWFKRAVARAFAGMPAVRRFAERQIDWLAFRFQLWVLLSPGRLNNTGILRSVALSILASTAALPQYRDLVRVIPGRDTE